MVENGLGPILTSKKTGEEYFTSNEISIDHNLQSFWQWGYSNILANTERGKLAEYIVACDLGVAGGMCNDWEPYDLETQSGIAVEVKSSAYIQTWKQKCLSNIIFSIRPAQAWDPITDEYDEEVKRRSRVYVFCLLDHKDQDTVDPLNLDQWRFFILPTSRLNEELPEQKGLTLIRLMKMEPVEAKYGEIGDSIESLLSNK